VNETLPLSSGDRDFSKTNSSALECRDLGLEITTPLISMFANSVSSFWHVHQQRIDKPCLSDAAHVNDRHHVRRGTSRQRRTTAEAVGFSRRRSPAADTETRC